jgi:hypothetical protein
MHQRQLLVERSMIRRMNSAGGHGIWPRDKRLLLLAVVLACGHALPILAHGDADWIMKNPDYVDQFGNKCCGPEDCERIPESFVREEGRDIYVLPTQQVFRKGNRGTYQSRDGSWWWCKSKQIPGYIRPPAACIFFPFHGH